MNVLLSDDPQFLCAPNMLVRSTRPVRRSGDNQDVWVLDGPGTHDFTTYFNALSIEKWKRYTVARSFFLHLEVRGAAGALSVTRADSFSYYTEDVPNTKTTFAGGSAWQTFELELPGNDGDVIEAFRIECEGPVEIRNAYYYTPVDEKDMRPVELALCTTTFKKEQYITRNIDLVRKHIIHSSNRIAQHFHMHVVDNGRTLDAQALSGDGVSVIPNDNVGGAGGFARGMIAAMEQEPRATHVLLMDDDVLVSPESIIRTFNLLTLVNDEYRDAFVSGSMMNMDEPYIRWEEMGFIGFDGAFHPLKPVARMDVLHDVVDNEAFDIPSYLPHYEDQAQHYAAWWYCVIPMTQIDKNGLPLPIFVRGDDVEYSRRCDPKFITMNGICIWHLAFHMRYNAAQERYQMTRNCFVDQYTSNFAPLSDFETNFRQAFQLELKKFNYADAALILDGFEDFLKGPAWLMSDEARTAFLDANKRAAKLEPLEDIVKKAAALGVDLSHVSDWQIERDVPYTFRKRASDRLTLNHQRAVKQPGNGGVAVIDNVGWAFPGGKIHGADTLITVDIPNRRGAIRTRDQAKADELLKRYRKLRAYYRSHKTRLKRAYQGARPVMTSVAFWKKYLGIQ